MVSRQFCCLAYFPTASLFTAPLSLLSYYLRHCFAMRLSKAGQLLLYVLPAACRVLPTLLTQYGGTNNTTLVEADGALPSVNDSPAFNLSLPQLLFTDSAPPTGSSPDLHVRKIPTHDLNAVEKQGHNNDLQSQSTHPTNENIAPEIDDVIAYATPAKRDFKHNDPLWHKAVCTGERLTQASMRDKDTAAKHVQPIGSDFDGTMEDDLKTWGYEDLSWADASCDLSYVAAELMSLGINADWSDRTPDGQNICYSVAHYYKSPEEPFGVRTYIVNNKLYVVIVCSCYGHTHQTKSR